MNTAQIASAARIAIVFLGGIAVSKGLVSQAMIDQASDITVLTQVIGGLIAVGTAIYGVWLRRPAGIVASAGDALKGTGVIIAPAAIANNSAAPANVVSTVNDALPLAPASAL